MGYNLAVAVTGARREHLQRRMATAAGKRQGAKIETPAAGALVLLAALVADAGAEALAGDDAALAWLAGAPAPVTYRQAITWLGLPPDYLPEGLEAVRATLST
jgi:hypothetical protein